MNEDLAEFLKERKSDIYEIAYEMGLAAETLLKIIKHPQRNIHTGTRRAILKFMKKESSK